MMRGALWQYGRAVLFWLVIVPLGLSLLFIVIFFFSHNQLAIGNEHISKRSHWSAVSKRVKASVKQN